MKRLVVYRGGMWRNGQACIPVYAISDHEIIVRWTPYDDGSGAGEDVVPPECLRLETQGLPRDRHGKLLTFSDYGGYPIYYFATNPRQDGGIIVCPHCAQEMENEKDPEYLPVHADANYEDPNLYCDCGARIPSAYAEPAESGIPNIDVMDADEADEYANVAPTPELAEYARLHARAWRYRISGSIETARVIERKLERIYASLPVDQRW